MHNSYLGIRKAPLGIPVNQLWKHSQLSVVVYGNVLLECQECASIRHLGGSSITCKNVSVTKSGKRGGHVCFMSYISLECIHLKLESVFCLESLTASHCLKGLREWQRFPGWSPRALSCVTGHLLPGRSSMLAILAVFFFFFSLLWQIPVEKQFKKIYINL